MPRIELVPQGWETSREKALGEGTPTVDVCCECALDFDEGLVLTGSVFNMLIENGIDVSEDDIVGCKEVMHPPFEMECYECDCCGVPLKDEDD